MSSYIYIDGWKSNIRFSSAHIIPEYEKCGRLHGHTYAVHAKVIGKPDEKGIILDFSILKDALREIVSILDHRVLIPEKSEAIKMKKALDNRQPVYIASLSFPERLVLDQLSVLFDSKRDLKWVSSLPIDGFISSFPEITFEKIVLSEDENIWIYRVNAKDTH